LALLCLLPTNGIPLGDNLETGFGPASRNIFRGPFQSRVDLGVFKNFRISERFRLKFDVQAFNIFNHPSFDTPNNNVEFNPFFADPPTYATDSMGNLVDFLDISLVRVRTATSAHQTANLA